jgi:transcriptional antiterminator
LFGTILSSTLPLTHHNKIKDGIIPLFFGFANFHLFKCFYQWICERELQKKFDSLTTTKLNAISKYIFTKKYQSNIYISKLTAVRVSNRKKNVNGKKGLSRV